MILVCKHCGVSDYRKVGFSKGKRRYECTNCSKIFSQGDRRKK